MSLTEVYEQQQLVGSSWNELLDTTTVQITTCCISSCLLGRSTGSSSSWLDLEVKSDTQLG